MKHSKKNILQYTDFIEVSFGDYIFYEGDYFITDIKHPRYLGTIVLRGITFENAILINNKINDSLSSIAYINKNFGLFLINDKLNDTEYFILK